MKLATSTTNKTPNYHLLLPLHRAAPAAEAEAGLSSRTSSTVGMTPRRRSFKRTALFALISVIALGAFVPVFAPLPSFKSPSSSLSGDPNQFHSKNKKDHRFEISNDQFWKDGLPFQIIGGDLHYFRVLPEYWEDRLLRAKALGLNTIQTYVPWNLHEPKPGKMVFEGIADIESFLMICKKLDLLVMLRVGPYICGEWDLGGFPPWLLAIEPALTLRSSDSRYIHLVEKWWSTLLPIVGAHLYVNGGPIIMVQIENEYGSFGGDKNYLKQLAKMARAHLGSNVILYTTDGGTRETLSKGTVGLADVFSAVDFSTGEAPWPIFMLQRQFNVPGKSPPLSSEFYTGWLTHWGEKNAATGAEFTATELEKILSRNGSAVLYMAHGGTNFGFYNGANTGSTEYDYKPDLTSYDYDAPIRESGDVDNEKYRAIRRVIERYSRGPLPSVPHSIEKAGYGRIQLQRTALLFDFLHQLDSLTVVESDTPKSMESVGQNFGFLLYVSKYTAADDGSTLSIPKVRDRGQVFVSCPSQGKRPLYVGAIERWSGQSLRLPSTKCRSSITLYILVENMGRVNYGQYMFDAKGILSSVYVNKRIVKGWKMFPVPLHNLNEKPEITPMIQSQYSGVIKISSRENVSNEPSFYTGSFLIEEVNLVKDSFISFNGWGKGIAYINNFNIGRFWPSVGPQCNLYVPAPILQHGENVVVVLELESPHPEHVLHSVDQPDFTCSPTKSSVHQL